MLLFLNSLAVPREEHCIAERNLASQRRRDRWGTLVGGEQNETMQKYVQEKTMADVEHQRWLAHKEAALAATFPTHLTLN